MPDTYTELSLPDDQYYLLTSDWQSDQSWVHYYGCDPETGGATITQNMLAGYSGGNIPMTNTVIVYPEVTGAPVAPFFKASADDRLRVKFWYSPTSETDIYVNYLPTTPYTNTLRVYGAPGWPDLPGNMGAGSGVATDPETGLLAEDQPYTDPIAIFNPQRPQAPRKDSLTWNPAFMSATSDYPDENSGLYSYIHGLSNYAEKVWFRMWYEPEHWDKDLNAKGFDRDEAGRPEAPVNPTPGPPSNTDEWYPAIMQEFTAWFIW